MHYEHTLDQATQQLIQEETAGGGEVVWWAGKPNPLSVIKSNIQISQILFGVVFVGVLIFIGRQFLTVFSGFASGPFADELIPSLFPYFFGAIFLFIAFNFLKGFLSPIWNMIGAFFTVYVITNQRAMIIQRLPRKSVTSYQPKDFDEIQRVGGNNLGDVFFSQKTVTQHRSNSINIGGGNGFGSSGFGNHNRRGMSIPIGTSTTNRTVRGGFVGVSDPQQVEELLLSLAKSVE